MQIVEGRDTTLEGQDVLSTRPIGRRNVVDPNAIFDRSVRTCHVTDQQATQTMGQQIWTGGIQVLSSRLNPLQSDVDRGAGHLRYERYT